MQVESQKVVSIDYTLKDDGGQVLDSSQGQGPLSYVHGAGTIIPGLEQAIEGKSQGEEFDVRLGAEDAYGQHDPNLVQAVPKAQFPEGSDPQVGQQFQAQTPEGARTVTVVQVEDDAITIDANHPLAGQTLNFDVKVVEVRDATPEELQHGHPHGPGGDPH